MSPPPRFWENISRGTPDQCWPWIRSLSKSGYGKANVDNRSVRAHREAWQRTIGEIPHGLCVCHRCDNRACCNPAHLFLATYTENNADKAAKGRQARGETNSKSKLNDDDVYLILHCPSYIPNSRIARSFGVDRTAISQIRNRKAWKHVEIVDDPVIRAASVGAVLAILREDDGFGGDE